MSNEGDQAEIDALLNDLDNDLDDRDGGNGGNGGSNSNNGGFRVLWCSKGAQQRQTERHFQDSETIYDLAEYLRNNELGGDKRGMDVIINSKTYGPDKHSTTLKSAGLINGFILASISFKVKGGATLANDEKEDYNQRIRLPRFRDEKRIKPTLKPDCLLGYNDRKKLRVEMPCGHVFAPLVLFKVAEMNANKHSSEDIRCPIKECNVIWPFECIVAGADLNINEAANYQRIFTNRKLFRIGQCRDCPKCKVLMSRPPDIKMLRVHCTSEECKSESDFCWACGKRWIGGGFSVCGNKECSTVALNIALQTCDEKHLMGRSDIKCPVIRACPRCYTLVTWKEACKHMVCPGCNESFCFYCLGLKDENGWNCIVSSGNKNSHTGQCAVAPRQNIK